MAENHIRYDNIFFLIKGKERDNKEKIKVQKIETEDIYQSRYHRKNRNSRPHKIEFFTTEMCKPTIQPTNTEEDYNNKTMSYYNNK